MSQEITFANFSPAQHRAEGVYKIGGGVIPEMGDVFAYDLARVPSVDNLSGFIGKIGNDKRSQENIIGVRQLFGEEVDALTVARGWILRSEHMTPVERSFMNTEAQVPSQFDKAIITGGIRNWMMRRATLLSMYAKSSEIENILLVGGSGAMKATEGPDVVEGMTQADYLESVIAPFLGKSGLNA